MNFQRYLSQKINEESEKQKYIYEIEYLIKTNLPGKARYNASEFFNKKMAHINLTMIDFFYDAFSQSISLNTVKKILVSCKPYFNSTAGNAHLLRGMKQDSFGIKKVRKDRVPKDMPNFMNDYVNEYLYQNFKTDRGELLFTTRKYKTAKAHGDLYLIIPIGKVFWMASKDIYDLYEDINEYNNSGFDLNEIRSWEEMCRSYRGDYDDDYDDEDYLDDVQEEVEEIQENVYRLLKTYKKNPNLDQIPEQNEIMVDCKSYYYIKVS